MSTISLHMLKTAFKSTLLFICLGILFLNPRAALADEYVEDSTPLCPPDVYLGEVSECASLGPSQYLTKMAQLGITLPQMPLPTRNPDPELNQVEYRYAYVNQKRSPIYRTLQDAVKEKNDNIIRKTTPGFNYVSYSDEVYENGKRYFNTDAGWVSSDYVTPTNIPRFQGVEFSQTPQHPFGWVLSYFSRNGQVETKRTPGYEKKDYTGHVLHHLEMVKIFDIKKVGHWNWYMVGPDEWIIQTSIAKVTPRQSPPNGEDWTRWIEINLYEQTVSAYEDGELVFATIMASGVHPYWTYPGTYQIYEKLNVTDMQGRFPEDRSDWYYLENVPWTMYFDESRALHGAYWRTSLGYPQSHGCVNLSVGDARWLYEWARLGDWVYVHDPSGKTPSHP